jgi:MFS family permease
LKRNISAIVAGEFISSIGWNAFYVLWQPYVLSLGASMTVLGALRGIRSAISSSLQLVTGRLSDGLGRKKPMMTAYLLSITSIAIALSASHWLQLIPTVLLLSIGEALWVPAAYSIVAESVEIGERGRAYSFLSAAWFLPGLVIPAATGLLADLLGLRSLLGVIIVTEGASLMIVRIYVSETHVGGNLELRGLIASVRRSIKPMSGLSRLYVVGILDRFSWMVGEGLFIGMLLKSLGFSLTQLGLLTNILSAATVIAQIPMGHLIDRYGRKPFLLSSGLLWFISLSGYLLSGSFHHFLLFHAVRGVSMAMWIPAFNAYLSDAVGENERGRAFGDLNAAMGLLSLPAPIVGGLLYDFVGFQGPITLSLILAVSTLMAIFTLEER